MADMFAQLLCGCCGRQRAHSVGEPDENTRLIRPDPENEMPVPTNYVVDHQVLKDRLGSIVRAKEGKMVNVTTPLPFNLHNATHDHADPSSSRSARSRSAHPVMGGLAESSTDMLPGLPSRISSYSPTRGRDLSPSIPTSRSTSSLHPGDASYLPPEADTDGGNRRPILNMRLVRGAGGYGVGGSFRPRKERSVPRGRVGPFSDYAGPGIPEDGGSFTQEDSATTANGSGSGRFSREPSKELIKTEAAIPASVDATLQDVGKITCSWGD